MYRSSACRQCPIRHPCTTGDYRRVWRREHEKILEATQRRLDRKPQAMTPRRRTIEHVFGTLKHWMGAPHFLTRGLRQAGTEVSLHVLPYNLKRVIRLLGMARTMKAMRLVSARVEVSSLPRCSLRAKTARQHRIAWSTTCDCRLAWPVSTHTRPGAPLGAFCQCAREQWMSRPFAGDGLRAPCKTRLRRYAMGSLARSCISLLPINHAGALLASNSSLPLTLHNYAA
jgi:hypothetical protein